MTRKPDTTEFTSSFYSYVRPTDDGIADNRADAARKMAAIPPSDFIELMRDVPHDVAAIFSGCVRVKDASTIATFASMKPKNLEEAIGLLKSCGNLPLVAEPNHPAGALFDAMIATKEGCLLYRDVATLLAWGREQPGMRVHFCGVDRHGGSSGNGGSEGGSSADDESPPPSGDGFLDRREDDDDRDDANMEER